MTRTKWTILIASALILIGMLIATRAHGQAASPSPAPLPAPAAKYQPTELESLRLQNEQKDARLTQAQMQALQQQMTALQSQFQSQLQVLTSDMTAVKKAHGWDDKVQADPNTLTFSDPPAPPAPAKDAPKP